MITVMFKVFELNYIIQKNMNKNEQINKNKLIYKII